MSRLHNSHTSSRSVPRHCNSSISVECEAVQARQLLFFEEVLERLTGVTGMRSTFRGGRRTGHGCGRRSVLLDRGAELVEGAVVSLVLRRNPLRDGLHAFESRGGIEKGALFAAVQIEPATWAFAFGIETRLQHRSAIRASRARDCANHSRRARPDLFLSGTTLRRPFFFFLGLVGTHVAPLLILPLQ
jgi:hypothetical protein